MTYITSQPAHLQQYHTESKPSPIIRFFYWAESQDRENHIAWVGITVTTMTAIFFPLTMALILMNGREFGLIIAAMVSLVLVVTSNLAAMPTKYTLPVFFVCIAIDLLVVVASFLI